MNEVQERVAGRAGLIRQVIDTLREQIVSGQWPVGSRIPTEPELVELTGAGRNTVREAVQSLVHVGLLDRRQGSGTYVLDDSELTVLLSQRVERTEPVHAVHVLHILWEDCLVDATAHRSAQDAERLQALARELHDHNAVPPDLVTRIVDTVSRCGHNELVGELVRGMRPAHRVLGEDPIALAAALSSVAAGLNDPVSI